MAAMSYVQKKVYIKEYEEAEREAGLAVYEAKICEDLYAAAPAPLTGTAFPELEAWEGAKAKVRDKHLA